MLSFCHCEPVSLLCHCEDAEGIRSNLVVLFDISYFLIIFFIFLLFSQPAFAEETQMEEIVVTATRIEEPKKDVPYSVQSITEEDIKTSVAKDAGDLIAESAAGYVSKYPGAHTTFYLRGFGGGVDPTQARNLILINGFRTATINLAQIPVDDIERK